MIERYQRCSSFQFYIKPQPLYECVPSCFVVPHSNSTSNHNVEETTLRSPQLFLIPILHQTTTDNRVLSLHSGCSSFQFYIKPQLSPAIPRKAFCCSSFQFYIKPQRSPALPEFPPGCSSFQFYIKPQQSGCTGACSAGCSSFQFYIKPQQRSLFLRPKVVVPHSNSTSNHNTQSISMFTGSVVPHSNSTSNHNSGIRISARAAVVPHSNSTSNHNGRSTAC